MSKVFLKTEEIINEVNIMNQCVEDIDSLSNKLLLRLTKVFEFSLANFSEEHSKKYKI